MTNAEEIKNVFILEGPLKVDVGMWRVALKNRVERHNELAVNIAGAGRVGTRLNKRSTSIHNQGAIQRTISIRWNIKERLVRPKLAI
jgi:hypothetical protein